MITKEQKASRLTLEQVKDLRRYWDDGGLGYDQIEKLLAFAELAAAGGVSIGEWVEEHEDMMSDLRVDNPQITAAEVLEGLMTVVCDTWPALAAKHRELKKEVAKLQDKLTRAELELALRKHKCDLHGVEMGSEGCPDCVREVKALADATVADQQRRGGASSK